MLFPKSQPVASIMLQIKLGLRHQTKIVQIIETVCTRLLRKFAVFRQRLATSSRGKERRRWEQKMVILLVKVAN